MNAEKGQKQYKRDEVHDRCSTGQDAGDDGCRTGRLQYSSDVGQVRCSNDRMQYRMTSEQVRCLTVLMLDMTDAGQVGYRTGQDRCSTKQIRAGQDICSPGWMQGIADAGQVI